MKKKPVLFIRAVMFVGLAFVTGWTASLWANNNGINSGLVKALNSVVNCNVKLTHPCN